MAHVTGTNASETLNMFDGVTNGDDTIYGYGGDDSLWGAAGNDYIVGGTGAADLHGRVGSDTASYFTAASGIMANLTTAEGSGGDAEGDTMSASRTWSAARMPTCWSATTAAIRWPA